MFSGGDAIASLLAFFEIVHICFIIFIGLSSFFAAMISNWLKPVLIIVILIFLHHHLSGVTPQALDRVFHYVYSASVGLALGVLWNLVRPRAW